MSTVLPILMILGITFVYVAIGVIVSAVGTEVIGLEDSDANAAGFLWPLVPVVLALTGIMAGGGWVVHRFHQQLISLFNRPRKIRVPQAKVRVSK